MADNKINTLVNSWKTNANLNLAADQEAQLTALLTGAVEKARARRDAGQQVLQQIQTAVESNDNATVEQLLQKLREGLRQAGEGRERFLDQFDQVLQPEQRARLVVYLVKRAKDSGRPVEQFVDALLAQGGEDN